jgi:hypothetical protein
MASQRKSFIVQKKVLVLDEYQKEVEGHRLISLDRKFGLNRHTLQGCVRHQEKLASAVQNMNIETQRTYRLKGGGRKTPFGSLEEQLHNWVKDKSSKGLKVKD